jgi:hypothetical protein
MSKQIANPTRPYSVSYTATPLSPGVAHDFSGYGHGVSFR